MEKSVLVAQDTLDKDFANMVESQILERHYRKQLGKHSAAKDIDEELAKWGVTLEDTPKGVRWTRKEK